MNFKKTVISNLTPAQSAAFDQNFNSNYVADPYQEALIPLTRTQPATSIENSPASLQQQRDALLGFTSDGNFIAITDGLAYLDKVMIVTGGVSSSTLSAIDGLAGAPSVKTMSASDGQTLVKNALGLSVVDNLNNPGLSERVGNYSASIFRSLQTGTFTPASYYQQGKSIAQSIHSYATSTALLPSPNTDTTRRSFELARNIQQSIFFGGLLDFSPIDVPQNSLYGSFGMAPALIGRIPDVKLRFLFYCDIEMWLDGTYQLMTIKSCSGPEAVFVQEDVNFYGLRSKVNKSVNYNNITLSLYDDVGNTAAGLYNRLMTASTGSFGRFAEAAQQRLQYVAGSAELSANEQAPATLPLLETNGIVKNIRTTMVYVRDGVVRRDLITYINPKLVSIKRSGGDMENSSEAGGIDFEFAYDALNIEVGLDESTTWREDRDRGNG